MGNEVERERERGDQVRREEGLIEESEKKEVGERENKLWKS